MFAKIEKEYKKLSKGRFFTIYYWCSVLLTLLLTTLFSYIFENFNAIRYHFTYFTLFILVFIYFYIDFMNVIKFLNVKKSEMLFIKIKKYINYNKDNYIDKLLTILKLHNFKTKSDLKLAIDYYNQKQPIKIDPNYLSWIVSIAITISSLVELAYNDTTQMIDFNKITIIFNISLQYTFIISISFLSAYWLIRLVFLPNKKVYSNIIDDLSYIYLNFNKFKSKLNKEK